METRPISQSRSSVIYSAPIYTVMEIWYYYIISHLRFIQKSILQNIWNSWHVFETKVQICDWFPRCRIFYYKNRLNIYITLFFLSLWQTFKRLSFDSRRAAYRIFPQSGYSTPAPRRGSSEFTEMSFKLCWGHGNNERRPDKNVNLIKRASNSPGRFGVHQQLRNWPSRCS